jgi:methoxymalonate biosynthesis acyl carrier protein
VSTPNQLTADRVEETLLEFLAARTQRSWQSDTDLFATGAVSSLFAMELIVHLESAFGVTVDGEELKIDNFRTVRTMAAMVQRLRDSTGSADESGSTESGDGQDQQ